MPSTDRLMHDRQNLVAMLAEYKAGQSPPLPDAEIANVVASLEERLASLDAMIAGLCSP
jgi:hypothetical protein